MYNKGCLPFKFSFIAKDYGSLLLYLWALIQLAACVDLLLFKTSIRCSVWTLIACLLLDSAVMHEPFTQLTIDREKEAVHFGCNFAMVGALLMRLGYRDLSGEVLN